MLRNLPAAEVEVQSNAVCRHWVSSCRISSRSIQISPSFTTLPAQRGLLKFKVCSRGVRNVENIGLQEWTEISKLPLSEALEIWRDIYSVQHPIEVMHPDALRDTSKALCQAYKPTKSLSMVDRFMHSLFEAEIMSTLASNLRHMGPDNFVVLLVWDEAREKVLGTVQVVRQNQEEVMKFLPKDEQSYAYISGMAVLSPVRRLGIGTALLSAAEYVAWVWGENEIWLHAHRDNPAACALYQKFDYVEVDRDPLWKEVLRPCTLLLRRQW